MESVDIRHVDRLAAASAKGERPARRRDAGGRGRQATEAGLDPLTGMLRLVAEREISLCDLTDSYIEAVLRLTGGNKVQAARILGIDRKTLYRRAERRHS